MFGGIFTHPLTSYFKVTVPSTRLTRPPFQESILDHPGKGLKNRAPRQKPNLVGGFSPPQQAAPSMYHGMFPKT